MRQGKNDKNEGDLDLNRATSRRSGQRRDVPEDSNNQRRNVEYQRRDVPER